jgi:hypothetical protein
MDDKLKALYRELLEIHEKRKEELMKEFPLDPPNDYGNIHFDLERSKTIQAQCFAALIVRGLDFEFDG